MAHTSAALEARLVWKKLEAVARPQTHKAVDVKKAEGLERTPGFG